MSWQMFSLKLGVVAAASVAMTLLDLRELRVMLAGNYEKLDARRRAAVVWRPLDRRLGEQKRRVLILHELDLAGDRVQLMA